MSKWLVTGGEGFIGGRIVALTGSTPYDLKSGKDILHTEELGSACSEVDGIFHCAAKISVPESFEKPDEYYLNNVEGTESVIRVAQDGGKSIVFSSSAAVYGEADHPVQEDDALKPQSPYAENKGEGEQMLLESGLPVCILRYFNVYGPGQSPAYAGVITAFIRSALNGDDLVIYGSGEQVRDFVYVDDVARANIVAMESVASGKVFNIGSGTRTSIRELAEKVIQLTDSPSIIRHAEPRQGDIVYSQADISKAEKMLGWKAETSLSEGLKKTIEFYRSH
jgi:UDP-glucose 4-epimerase